MARTPEPTPAAPVIGTGRASGPHGVASRISEALLDAAEARTEDASRVSRGRWRDYGGATLWAGLLIVAVKLALAAALFLMLAKSL